MPSLMSLNRMQTFKQGENKASVFLYKLSPKDDKPTGQTLSLQYWPETFKDDKTPDYQTKKLPGANLPLYSWVGGGERIISFSTTMSTDLDLTKWASRGAGADVDATVISQLKSRGLERRNIDIRAAMLWLRSFQMPTYTKDAYMPPPKVILVMPGTGIGLMAGMVSGGVQRDHIYAVMTKCDFEIKASFPNGNPRLVQVDLAFAQIAQIGGVVNFPGFTEVLQNIYERGAHGISAYPVKPNW